MSKKIIIVGRDFTPTPIGRYKTDSKWSGEAFREDVLIPALETNDSVTVDLSGVAGYGSSFLEEAFGGLVRKKKYSRDELDAKLNIVASDPNFVPYILCVKSYMSEAWQQT